MALQGSQPAVLRAIEESPTDSAGYVSDEQVARLTQVAIDDVRDWLITLQDDGLVSLSRTTNGYRALMEARGRIELRDHQERLKYRKGGVTAVIEKAQSKIRPKGLRSFDKEDAEFFLELLPGPYDHDGLPDGISFWKIRIEDKDPDRTLKVGVIYGPSGCGKSSLVKAGLLPRLPDHIMPVYVEATTGDTESRLLKGLRRRCPELPTDLGLIDSVVALHQGHSLPSGKKILLVIDQFEQWLLARRGERGIELVEALRHCGEERVQAIVIVRDDFLSAAIQFMEGLGIEFRPSLNARRVDLFGRPHAKKVLAAFGQSYGVLGEDLTPDQQAFLNQSVDGLARDGIIIPVRLALFAEMLKGREWTPNTLKELGGTEGVGFAFLEETFSSSYADPRHRAHQEAARSVLKALLPEGGSDLKGPKRSMGELLKVSGYASHPSKFDDLIDILDSELRLITPTASEVSTSEDQPIPFHEEPYYQLTHDYLVHSLRDWLTRKQRETRRGRAELLLEERESVWRVKHENRHLPSALEWIRIRLLTLRKDWTGPQREMMRRAGQVRGLRALVLVALITLGTWGVIEGSGNLRASALVEELQTADTTDVPQIIEQLSRYRRWANPRLVRMLKESEPTRRDHLHASLALLAVDASRAEYLYHRILNANPAEFPVLRDALKPYRTKLTPQLWSVLNTAKPADAHLLPAAGALAVYDSTNPRWPEVSGKVAQALVSVNSIYLGDWSAYLRNVGGELTAPLATIFRNKNQPQSERTQAVNILAEYTDDAGLLVNLLVDSEEKTFAVLFEKLKARRDTVSLLESKLKTAKEAYPDTKGDEKDGLAQRQARAAVALLKLRRDHMVWDLLQHAPDPGVRSFIVNWLKPLGADPRLVAARLGQTDEEIKPSPAPGQQKMEAILFHDETSMRRALILALGTYGTEGLSMGEREPLIAKLLDMYRSDPDAGIHGTAEWTLRQWEQGEKLKLADGELIKLRDKEWGDRRWFVNGQGQTFAVIDGPVEFLMGSPLTELHRDVGETLHRVHIPRRYAIASMEVSVEQYQRFINADRTNRQHDPGDIRKWSPGPLGPQIGPSWYDAVAYCNWLSKEEGLEPCYEPNKGEYADGMKTVDKFLERSGYRLPTEAEWEYACRAGAVTSRYYGGAEELLGRYAWYYQNSGLHSWRCGQLQPNDLGLFDMLGNVCEWCQDQSSPYPSEERNAVSEDVVKSSLINDNSHRFLRGTAWSFVTADVRSANRVGFAPSFKYIYTGFRISRTYY